jgi:hypothetical protein
MDAMSPPTWTRIALAIALCGAFSCSGQSAPAAPDNRVPILVELFTSEGCSDCPPADKLLAQLDATQPVPGARAIVLEEHVTYWDRQGWRDPFSLDEVTDRQQQYQFRFQLQDVFTPQMVVDGAVQFVGNDPGALGKALTSAATTPKQALTIDNAHWQNGAAEFTVHSPTPSGSRLVAVLAADTAHTDVLHGENAGHTLQHIAVLRVIKEFKAEEANGHPLRLSGGSLDHGNEATGPVRLIVFLVDHKTGHVLAVAEQTLTRTA